MIRDDTLTVNFSDDLGYIFGFIPNRWYEKGSHKNTTPPDIESGFSSLFVYSDLGVSRVVGNSFVPLLRVVPVEGKRFQTIHKEFQDLQYIRVVNGRASIINVLITTGDGRIVPFRGGKVVVTLHLRRISR